MRPRGFVVHPALTSVPGTGGSLWTVFADPCPWRGPTVKDPGVSALVGELLGVERGHGVTKARRPHHVRGRAFGIRESVAQATGRTGIRWMSRTWRRRRRIWDSRRETCTWLTPISSAISCCVISEK